MKALLLTALQACFAFDIIGILMCLLLLVLSAKRIGPRFNIGPRIFAVNLMLVNMLHAICGLITHGGLAYSGMQKILGCKEVYFFGLFKRFDNYFSKSYTWISCFLRGGLDVSVVGLVRGGAGAWRCMLPLSPTS